jgi:uncharacterized membrane protein
VASSPARCFAPTNQNLIDFTINGGLTMKAPLTGRDDDMFGVGFGVANVSRCASALDRDSIFSGGFVPTRGAETFVEVTYQIQLTPRSRRRCIAHTVPAQVAQRLTKHMQLDQRHSILSFPTKSCLREAQSPAEERPGRTIQRTTPVTFVFLVDTGETMASSTGVMPAASVRPLRMKYLVFAAITMMAAYVLYHNERFLLDPAHPVWKHYEPLKWWLLPHGLAGICALLLAPMQFAEGLRRRHTALHRTTGTIYVISAFILAPLGLYIQYLDEAQGAARSFTIETMIQSSTLMITTGIGCYFALKRQFTYHRQWMIRSYAVALTFLEIRVILGVFGLDQPFDWHIVETVVWSCVASSVLIGDIANQLYEGHLARRRTTGRASDVALSSGIAVAGD